MLFISSPSNDGIGRVDTTAPDTITTWHGEAVAMSRNMGIGFSELKKLTVYKPFFVSLELPYSVNFGEKVVIKPVVFNFWEKGVEVGEGVSSRYSSYPRPRHGHPYLAVLRG